MNKNIIDISQYKIKILRFLSDRRMCIDDLKTFKMEDCNDIAKWIYVVIWGDYLDNEYALPNLIDDITSFDAGDDKYGGDTMNPCYDSIYYLTISNFMVLPKGKATSNKKTMNQYKGLKSIFNDDLYLFLNKVKDLYENDKHRNIDDIWEQLFVANQDYFNHFGKGQKGFDEFIKRNLLNNWEFLKEQKPDMIEKFIKERADNICEILKQRLKL